MGLEIPGMTRKVTEERLERAGIVAMPLPESDPGERLEIYELYKELGGVAIEEYEEMSCKVEKGSPVADSAK